MILCMNPPRVESHVRKNGGYSPVSRILDNYQIHTDKRKHGRKEQTSQEPPLTVKQNSSLGARHGLANRRRTRHNGGSPTGGSYLK